MGTVGVHRERAGQQVLASRRVHDAGHTCAAWGALPSSQWNESGDVGTWLVSRLRLQRSLSKQLIIIESKRAEHRKDRPEQSVAVLCCFHSRGHTSAPGPLHIQHPTRTPSPGYLCDLHPFGAGCHITRKSALTTPFRMAPPHRPHLLSPCPCFTPQLHITTDT